MGQSVTGIQGTQGSQATNHDAFAAVDLQDFIKLLVTELQSQDPMEPVDNSKILEQVSQIRAIESNTRLNDTLSSVALGQNLSTAGSLLGRQILGLGDNGKDVAGTVDSASVVDGEVKLNVGDATVSMKNISIVLP
jgi:flagellar basal-body rod modification protein FlgD